jgi:hypothetical protein
VRAGDIAYTGGKLIVDAVILAQLRALIVVVGVLLKASVASIKHLSPRIFSSTHRAALSIAK